MEDECEEVDKTVVEELQNTDVMELLTSNDVFDSVQMYDSTV